MNRKDEMGKKDFTFGSLFAGIGGIDLGLERAGMVCEWQVEIDPFCLKVLKKHWSDVERHEDVRKCGKHNLKAVDLVCGGFPCQDVSVAGKRQGLTGERSGLWFEMLRIIRELEPQWVLVENVPGLLSIDSGGGVGTILRDLAKGGYDAEWDCIPAAALGAPHRRDRVFVVAHSKSIFRHVSEINGIWSEESLGTARQFGRHYFEILPPGSPWTLHQPQLCRKIDGLPGELDMHQRRLKAVGNAVVPQVAEWIGQRILGADRTWTR